MEELDTRIQTVKLILLQLFVHVANIETGLQWFWPREKFYNRAAVMKELFNQFDDDDDDFDGNLADVSYSCCHT